MPVDSELRLPAPSVEASLEAGDFLINSEKHQVIISSACFAYKLPACVRKPACSSALLPEIITRIFMNIL